MVDSEPSPPSRVVGPVCCAGVAGWWDGPMSEHKIDPIIAEYVDHVANRFGAAGLEDLIEQAGTKLTEARAALEELRELGG